MALRPEKYLDFLMHVSTALADERLNHRQKSIPLSPRQRFEERYRLSARRMRKRLGKLLQPWRRSRKAVAYRFNRLPEEVEQFIHAHALHREALGKRRTCLEWRLGPPALHTALSTVPVNLSGQHRLLERTQ
jgi:hypothetical protein